MNKVKEEPACGKSYAMDATLINEVYQHPCLYDKRHYNNGNKEYINKCWEDIGAAIDTTGHEARRRWINIRDYFRKIVKERAREPASNKLGRALRKKKWYLFDYMRFMIPHMNYSRPFKLDADGEDDTSAVDVIQKVDRDIDDDDDNGENDDNTAIVVDNGCDDRSNNADGGDEERFEEDYTADGETRRKRRIEAEEEEDEEEMEEDESYVVYEDGTFATPISRSQFHRLNAIQIQNSDSDRNYNYATSTSNKSRVNNHSSISTRRSAGIRRSSQWSPHQPTSTTSINNKRSFSSTAVMSDLNEKAQRRKRKKTKINYKNDDDDYDYDDDGDDVDNGVRVRNVRPALVSTPNDRIVETNDDEDLMFFKSCIPDLKRLTHLERLEFRRDVSSLLVQFARRSVEEQKQKQDKEADHERNAAATTSVPVPVAVSLVSAVASDVNPVGEEDPNFPSSKSE